MTAKFLLSDMWTLIRFSKSGHISTLDNNLFEFNSFFCNIDSPETGIN